MGIPNSVRYFQKLNEMVKELASEMKGEKMKLVKLDDVLELIDGSMADLESNYENSKLQEEIKRLPTVDAVEVVCCKDCIHSATCTKEIIMRMRVGSYLYCPMGDEGFCSHGERREDE